MVLAQRHVLGADLLAVADEIGDIRKLDGDGDRLALDVLESGGGEQAFQGAGLGEAEGADVRVDGRRQERPDERPADADHGHFLGHPPGRGGEARALFEVGVDAPQCRHRLGHEHQAPAAQRGVVGLAGEGEGFRPGFAKLDVVEAVGGGALGGDPHHGAGLVGGDDAARRPDPVRRGEGGLAAAGGDVEDGVAGADAGHFDKTVADRLAPALDDVPPRLPAGGDDVPAFYFLGADGGVLDGHSVRLAGHLRPPGGAGPPGESWRRQGPVPYSPLSIFRERELMQ